MKHVGEHNFNTMWTVAYDSVADGYCVVKFRDLLDRIFDDEDKKRFKQVFMDESKENCELHLRQLINN